MDNAQNINIDNIKLNILVYGPSGVGKTTFGCSFRDGGKVYVADFDKGMLSQRGKDVEYDTFTLYSDFQVRMQEWERECPFDTVVLDSVTTMQEYMMDDLLRVAGKKMMTLNEWNILIANIKDLLMRLTKMSKNTIVVAHEQLIQDGITGEIKMVPLITGKKLPPLFPLWFDEVYHFGATKDSKGTPVYYFDTVAQDKYMGKSRLKVLPNRVEWSREGEEVSAYQLIKEELERKK